MERIDNVVKKTKRSAVFDNVLKKFKSIKNIEYIVAAIFIGIVLLIFFSGGIFSKNSKEEQITISLAQYGAAVEGKMEKILSRIEGAGQVKVMITFESGKEIITAVTVNSQTNTVTDKYSGGYRETESSVNNNTPVIVGGKAVILKEIEPKVKGVIIVSQGAASVKVKIELTKAVSTLLNIDTKNIEIFVMSK